MIITIDPTTAVVTKDGQILGHIIDALRNDTINNGGQLCADLKAAFDIAWLANHAAVNDAEREARDHQTNLEAAKEEHVSKEQELGAQIEALGGVNEAKRRIITAQADTLRKQLAKYDAVLVESASLDTVKP